MAKKNLMYEIWVPSWESISDIERHLRRVANLGVNYVWLSGLLMSPGYDHGYDVSDYKAVNPKYGTMADFDILIKTAHNLGLKVLIDLVLNHTSTEHEWFSKNLGLYCWRYDDLPYWQSLFGGPAWKYDAENNMYYLHLFHEKQADLNWFPDGKINSTLVLEFKKIVEFWTKDHQVDGFRLDVPQAINKDFNDSILDLPNLIEGSQDRAIEVINSIFPRQYSRHLVLAMECLDPTRGKIVNTYASSTRVDFIMNILLKNSILEGINKFKTRLGSTALNSKKLMVDLESHDSPRFSGSYFSPIWGLGQMFSAPVDNVCLYQGQELGLKNPTKHQLTDEKMLLLDAETATRFKYGEKLDDLRLGSRANARMPFSIYLPEYDRQENDPRSCLNELKEVIKKWKK